MNGVSKTLTARAGAIAALAALCLLIGSAHAAVVPANNGTIAYKSGANIATTAGGCAVPGSHPAYSPDGTEIAFDDGTSIYTMSAACTGVSSALVSGTEPSWSPDGSMLAYLSGNNVWTYTFVGAATSQRTFTNDASDPAFAPSAAGSLIAYIAGGTALETVSAAGPSLTNPIPTGGPPTPNGSPTWSPDGSQMAFSASSGQIGIVSSSGGTPSFFTDGQTDTEPAWSPDGTLIAFHTSTGISTYSPSTVAFASVTGSALDTQPDWQTAPPTIITGTTNLPLISGTTPPNIGTVLTASTSSFHWNGSPTKYSFQWFRCTPSCTTSIQGPSALSSTTFSTYTVTGADVGDPIVVAVTASNVAGSSVPVQSLPAGAVAGPAPANLTKPVINGQPKAFPNGTSVSATSGTWSGTAPITFAYQWQYCDYLTPPQCADIPLATSSFYSPTGDYIGKRLQVIVTATNGQGAGTATSAFSFPVTGEQPRNTVSPKITGTIEVSSTLTADIGTWTGSVPLHNTYQWLRCGAQGSNCVPIPGATS
ncbi:MAG TPA: hypothetical protein VMU34_09015, partial [Mycobacterium sp.]|nr:hypothetical protein [Mycobacterium sp.]